MAGDTLTRTTEDIDRAPDGALPETPPLDRTEADAAILVERARQQGQDLIDGLGGLLTVGSRCEVRSSFTGRWTAGFEVMEASGDGCTVRRLSDGWVLPARFRIDDCRPV